MEGLENEDKELMPDVRENGEPETRGKEMGDVVRAAR